MNEKEPIGQSLRRAFAPHDPDPELRQKVQTLTRRSKPKPLLLACGVAGLAASASLAVFMVLPTTGLAEAVIKQAGVFEGHLVTYMVLPNGRWQRTGDQWTKGGKLRVIDSEGGRTEYLHDPDRGYDIMWSADNGTVRIRRSTGEGNPGSRKASPLPEVLTLQNLKAFLASQGVRETPRIERTEFNGQPADCIILFPNRNIENKLYADVATHRMLGWSYRMTKVWPANPPENNYTRVEVVDQKPIPARIFEPVFNINGVLTDVLANRDTWRDLLSKPLKVFSIKLASRNYLGSKEPAQTQTIAVRSVVVNQAGDVFVLFTGVDGDYGTNVVPTTIRDFTGGRYVKGIGFKPSEDGDRKLDGFNFEGKPLEGAWFVRIRGGQLKGPISVGFRQEFEPEKKLACTYTAEPERIVNQIPGYMLYTFLPIGTPETWLSMRLDVLASDRQRARDFATEERWLRRMITLEQSADRKSRQLPVDLFCRLARCLENQGKKHDAYAAYLRAQKALATSRFYPGSWAKQEIDGGIARLGKRNG